MTLLENTRERNEIMRRIEWVVIAILCRHTNLTGRPDWQDGLIGMIADHAEFVALALREADTPRLGAELERAMFSDDSRYPWLREFGRHLVKP